MLNKISMYIHCSLCVEEVKEIEGESPQSYSRYSTGWTEQGIQVWCSRHNCNIAHVDFEGHQHPTNPDRLNNKLRLVKQ